MAECILIYTCSWSEFYTTGPTIIPIQPFFGPSYLMYWSGPVRRGPKIIPDLRRPTESKSRQVYVTVAEDCGQLLTDVEYSRVDGTSKVDTESAAEELFEILLSKEEDFDAICSALRGNGYEELVARLEEEANAKKRLVVAPRNYKMFVKVEQAWN